MNLACLNPHIRYAKTFHAYTLLRYNSVCYDCRIFFIDNASGYIAIGDQKYNISNGDVIYLPPRTKYRLHFNKSDNFDIIVINFDLTDDFAHITSSLGTVCESNFVPERSPSYTPCAPFEAAVTKSLPHLKATLRECVDIFFRKPVFYRERVSALLKLCLLDIGSTSLPKTPYSIITEQVLLHIQENYSSPSLSNTEIAIAFSYHPYHLSRIIKSETGKTLHQHITNYRLRVAKNMLVTTNMDIEEISWHCGFCSAAYFIKTFRAKVGITPKKYRQASFNAEF